jgi:multidrug efflux pump subunit AcrB
MKLPQISIDNYQFTLIIFIVLLFAGMRSFLTMPRTENPEIVIPGVSILAIYPGANPVDMEQLVASPIEESINELDNIKRINTTLLDGVASIAVEFDFNTNADEKFDEVQQQINTIMNDLPDELISLTTSKWSSSDVAMVQLALTSSKSDYNTLNTQAELLEKEMEKIPGVKQADILAYPGKEVRVSIDMEKMALMNVSLEQVGKSIASNNANIPGGTMELGSQVFGIKTSGSYEDLNEIRRTIVSSNAGKLIYLENIATVEFTHGELNYLARFPVSDPSGKGSQTSLFLVVKQKEKWNVLDITKEIESVTAKFARSLDNSLSLNYVFNQSAGVNYRINNFMNNLIQGIILVGLLILLALGFKSALVVIIAIPLSILIGLGIIDMAGYGLQQISIAALVVALGLLVDNSIVMVENINRHLALGHTPRRASIMAASEIGWPVVSATITTVLAFIPLAAMPYMAGLFIRSLPYTIIATLLVSLFVSLTLTPMITGKLFKKTEPVDATRNTTEKGVKKYLKVFIEGPYRKSLKFALKNRGIVILVSLAFLGVSLFAGKFLGVSFFPKAEQASLLIKIQTPEGTNIDRTDEVARYVESILDTLPEVKYYATNVGHGNPRIYYNTFPHSYRSNFADIYVEGMEYDPSGFDSFVEKLRTLFNSYPGARIWVKEFEQGPPIEAPVQIYLTGKELDKLAEISGDFEKFLRGQEGIINLNNAFTNTKTDLYFNINREKANLFGVPVHVIDQTIRTALTGTPVSKFRDKNGKEFDIVLRLPLENNRSTLADIDKIYVQSLSGNSIPLRQLAKAEFRQSPSIITRYNLDRTAEITADIRKGYSLDAVMAPVIEKLDTYSFPAGYSYHIAGEFESRSETFGGTGTAALIALIAIFAVLVLQFKSFIQPLIVFVALPFAFIGSVWALLITGNSFSFTAFIGLTSLIGIVVNNSIIMVDYTNILRKQGKPILEALQTAGETRFTPILLTSVTTMGGLLPLTLRGGTLWAPLGWTIIGGLFVSTALTLIMVPVFYKVLIKEKERESIS